MVRLGGRTISAVIMGGFICLGLVMFRITATIVLSFISVDTPNHSEEGWGEGNSIYKKKS